MGYASNICGKNFIDWSKNTTEVNLSCQGTTRIRNVYDSGIGDVNLPGTNNTLNEFNRCFYERPIDIVKHPAMSNYNHDGVIDSILS